MQLCSFWILRLPIGLQRATCLGWVRKSRPRRVEDYKYSRETAPAVRGLKCLKGLKGQRSQNVVVVSGLLICRYTVSGKVLVQVPNHEADWPRGHCLAGLRRFFWYRFSAFWLRSSVVSVLISLISDTSPTRGPYIKLIFGTGRWNRGLLRPLHASTRYCITSGNGAPPSSNSVERQRYPPESLLICVHLDLYVWWIYVVSREVCKAAFDKRETVE